MTLYLALAGFAMMIAFIILLMSGKVSPMVAFIAIPLVFCLILGFPAEEAIEYIQEGLTSVLQTAAMFIFAIIFFGVLSDAGIFDVIVGKLLKIAGNSIRLICIMTVIITMVASLDGAGAATWLIAIPPLYAIYKKMNMRPTVLMCLASLTASIMNMVPWGGPAGRATAGLGIDPGELWSACLPTQIFSLACITLLALYFAYRENNRISALASANTSITEMVNEKVTETVIDRKKFWINVLMMIIVIAMMMLTDLPPFVIFMGGTVVVLSLNFSSVKEQNKHLESYAPACMTMVSMVLASGVFVGIMSKSPIMDAMVQVVIEALPASLAPHLHLLFALIVNPLQVLGVSQTATCYSILPIITKIVSPYNISAVHVGAAWLLAVSPPVFVSPVTASMYIGLGLSNVELKDHIKMTYKWSVLLSALMLAFAVLTKSIPF